MSMSETEVAQGPSIPSIEVQEGDLQVVARQLAEMHEAEKIIVETGDEDKCEILVLPQGRRAVSVQAFLEQYREKPKRIRGRARLMAPESFVAHVNRFKGDTTAIFADVLSKPPRLTARYDYHDKGRPEWQEHSAVYEFPESEEWKQWKGKNASLMSMEEFAYFLETRVMDVLHPTSVKDDAISKMAALLSMDWASPQTLLQLSKSLSIHTESKLTQVTDLQGGKKNFSFVETDKDEAGQPLTLPGGFLIQVAVFEGATPWIIPVLLRYRKQGGKAHFAYELYRADSYVLESMRETCSRVAHETEVPLFYGKPEASLGLKSETDKE
jgi:uncharacterized protein YfdQ (DUF2303 family)